MTCKIFIYRVQNPWHWRNSDDKRRRKRWEKIVVGRRENAQPRQKEANATVKWATASGGKERPKSIIDLIAAVSAENSKTAPSGLLFK